MAESRAMTDDGTSKLEQVGGALFKHAVPFGGLVSDVLRIFVPDNTEAFRQAFIDEIYDELCRVREQVKILKQSGVTPDTFQPTQAAHLSRKFTEARTNAYSQKQVDALVSTCAAQFDPRRGDKGRRKFWLDVVASLTIEELEAIDLLANNPVVIPDEGKGRVYCLESAKSGSPVTDVQAELAFPVLRGLRQLVSRGLVLKGSRTMLIDNTQFSQAVKTQAFDVLTQYIHYDPTKGSTEEPSSTPNEATPPTV